MNTKTKNTLELAEGDVVCSHGMRVLLRHEGTKQTYTRNGSTVVSWTGEVLNMEEVLAEGFVPPSFIREGFWTIQGNHLARWAVETGEEVAPAAAPKNPVVESLVLRESPDWIVRRYRDGHCDAAQVPGPGLSPGFDSLDDAVRWVKGQA